MANSSSAGRFRTPMSRARGLGASGHGVAHFIVDRVAGLALIPLALWGVFAFLAYLATGFETYIPYPASSALRRSSSRA